ncbi:hypothetical protein [Halosaccharopolyspora lacisalsi]|uniref:hypothetical protein n=1 Tax=Halosaccharopolyspora lacisalsi TaxID=1000566 RepID=UPI001C7263B3|nr:hypothetical protein [Halosaccharopolyspora lacisalsi]
MHTATEVLAQQAPVIPNPSPGVPRELQDFGNTVVAALKWLLLVSGVGGLLACSIMIAIGRRNRNQLAQQGIFDAGFVLIGLALGSMAATLVGIFAI